jgi:hypothetical protein
VCEQFFCSKLIAIERNGMKVSDLTEKIPWNIVVLETIFQRKAQMQKLTSTMFAI